ncbi:hypothetical protein CWI37_0048p0020 [Hamiltosporidium tvaerminnensis]|uniref:Uncharacterized protein n=1 Tax=Hamiltosporidium tvaerminnensis TaxID=1176355 RepID=A0A4Q9LBB3_9MICR|nr:hypothetical protein CWI37_0048p0020 [Hamiltosporidium tvaerminnensis]
MKIFIASTIAFIGYVFGQTSSPKAATTEQSEQGLGTATSPGEARADEPKAAMPAKANPPKRCPPGAKGYSIFICLLNHDFSRNIMEIKKILSKDKNPYKSILDVEPNKLQVEDKILLEN